MRQCETASDNKRALFSSKLDFNLRKKLVKCCIWSIAFYGVENWTLCEDDQRYVENFQMWCWRRLVKVTWTDRMRNEEALHSGKEERTNLCKMKRRKANRIGHILRRNCLMKNVIEGKMEGRI
jgi:hypothetical protein